MSTTAVSTILYKVDWPYILANFKREELWKKEWTIFDYNGVRVTMLLDKIDISGNSLELRTRVYLNDERIHIYSWNSDISIPLSDKHYNEDIFNRKVHNEIERKIIQVEVQTIKDTELYLEAVALDERVVEGWEQDAYDFLDEQGVYNDDIRDAYKDKHVSTMEEEYTPYTSKIVSQLQFTQLTPCYIMNSYLNGKDEQEQRFYQYLEVDKEQFMADIKEEVDNFDFKAMEDLSKENLESL